MLVNRVSLLGSLVTCGYFLFATDMDRRWKAIACALTGLALGLQFGVELEGGLLAIPIVIQCVVVIWGSFHFKLNSD